MLSLVRTALCVSCILRKSQTFYQNAKKSHPTSIVVPEATPVPPIATAIVHLCCLFCCHSSSKNISKNREIRGRVRAASRGERIGRILKRTPAKKKKMKWHAKKKKVNRVKMIIEEVTLPSGSEQHSAFLLKLDLDSIPGGFNIYYWDYARSSDYVFSSVPLLSTSLCWRTDHHYLYPKICIKFISFFAAAFVFHLLSFLQFHNTPYADEVVLLIL